MFKIGDEIIQKPKEELLRDTTWEFSTGYLSKNLIITDICFCNEVCPYEVAEHRCERTRIKFTLKGENSKYSSGFYCSVRFKKRYNWEEL